VGPSFPVIYYCENTVKSTHKEAQKNTNKEARNEGENKEKPLKIKGYQGFFLWSCYPDSNRGPHPYQSHRNDVFSTGGGFFTV